MKGCLISFTILLLSSFIEIAVLNTTSVDPAQTPNSAASDLGLHCLQMSLLWDARHKWVKGVVLCEIVVISLLVTYLSGAVVLELFSLSLFLSLCLVFVVKFLDLIILSVICTT